MTIKKLWHTVNDLTNRKQANDRVEHILIDIQSVSDKADQISQHFVNIGKYSEQHDNTAENTTIATPSASIMLAPTTPREVTTIIDSLKNIVAASDDGIKTVQIKYIAALLSPLLSDILNKMLVSGDFPDELKLAKVIPIYKGAGATDIHNYRPISFLPIFSKMYERVINDRLTSFFLKYGIKPKEQYGFKKHKSTEKALQDIKDKIVENIKNN